MEEDHEREQLLKILQSHGQQFLDSFSDSPINDKKRKQSCSNDGARETKSQKLDLEEEFEDWDGFCPENESELSGDEEDGTDISDDDFTGDTAAHWPNVVVFTPPTRDSSAGQSDRSRMKAFMSSKISKLRRETTPPSASKATIKDEVDADLTNIQNDALLHRLVHTRLLSGSLNPDLNLSGAQRRKALEGRAMELAGKSKVGRGESLVRETEWNKAAKRVRLGIVAKRKERATKELEETKNLGNYHPTLTRMYGSPADTAAPFRKRDRGLKMGVGQFKGGILRLRREEISSVEGSRGGRKNKSRKKS